jgi:hypothetical protein
VSEQPRSVPPQQLAQTLGRRARRAGNRPLGVPQQGSAALSIAPEPIDDIEAEALKAASSMGSSMPQLPPTEAVADGGESAEVPGPDGSALTAALAEPVGEGSASTPSKPAGAASAKQTSGGTGKVTRRPKAAQARSSKSSARSDAATDQLPVATAVYVPLDVRDLVVARRKSTDQTAAEVVMRAIESQYARLPELIEALSQPEVGTIFTFAAPSKKKETKVQMGLRMTRGQLRVLDEVEGQVGATSRGQLVTAAVRAELGK